MLHEPELSACAAAMHCAGVIDCPTRISYSPAVSPMLGTQEPLGHDSSQLAPVMLQDVDGAYDGGGDTQLAVIPPFVSHPVPLAYSHELDA